MALFTSQNDGYIKYQNTKNVELRLRWDVTSLFRHILPPTVLECVVLWYDH